MVTPKDAHRWPTRTSVLLVDAVGALAVAAILVASVYVITAESRRTRTGIGELRGRIKTARQELSRCRSAVEQEREALSKLEADLATRGRLPVETPIEEYFGSLSNLAGRHGVRVVRQEPLATRRYAGLVEQRFAYKVTGTTSDLIAFLGAIERMEFWADVSYLKVEGGQGGAGQADHERVAELTLSLFSAPSSSAVTENG